TVGLSLGNPDGLSLSADFSPLGKGLIILTMIAGRVGVLGFMLALVGREKPSHVRLPEARVLL
ncbi:MAG: potassium transporter, partial [Aquificota bacterium]